MKKILFVIVAMAMCASNAKAFDNEPEEGLSWMGFFGMNISKLQNTDYTAKAGATMGFRGDYVLPRAHGTYLTSGIDWTMKGGKMSIDYVEPIEGKTYSASAKYPLHYFEIPVRVGFRYNATEELGFYGEVGPYFAVGIGGKHRLNIDEDGEAARQLEDELTYKAFKKTGDLDKLAFQRWDAGVGFRIGAEYNNHYNFMFGCDWGLADIYRDNLRDKFYDANGFKLPKVHNFNISLTFGYRF